MPPIVFIVETEEDASPADGRWLTGRFAGSLQDGPRLYEPFDDLSLDEALAWARARADRVLLRHGEEPDIHYSAGNDHPEHLPRWPPEDLPPLTRRRHPDERWRDRTDVDPPIAWRVEARLTPPAADGRSLDELRRCRDGWAAEVRGAAARARADAWDCEPLDQLIADLGAAEQQAGGHRFGWFTSGSVALRLTLTVPAATAGGAEGEARRRLDLPPDWRAAWLARPADAGGTGRT